MYLWQVAHQLETWSEVRIVQFKRNSISRKDIKGKCKMLRTDSESIELRTSDEIVLNVIVIFC